MNRKQRTTESQPRQCRRNRMTPPVRRRRAHGFTLIELMITLTVAVILIAIAIPSFNYLTVSSKLTTVANDLVTALNVARSEAVKRNTNVDLAADGEVSVQPVGGGAKTVIRAAITLPPALQYSSGQALVATPIGTLETAGTGTGFSGLAADISSNAISSNNHRCIYVTTGTVVSSCTDSTTCQGVAPNASCK